MSDGFLITEEFIRLNQSPGLQPTQPIYISVDTPPPLDEVGEEYETNITEATGKVEHIKWSQSSKSQPQPSLCDSLLVKLLGPDYPDVALKAAREFITLSRERACEDRRPPPSATRDQMLDRPVQRMMSGTVENHRELARAAYEASEKLNAAIQYRGKGYPATALQSISVKKHHTIHVCEVAPDSVYVASERHQDSINRENAMAQSPLPNLLTSKPLNIKRLPKVSLPPIRTNNPSSRSDLASDQGSSIATSPALAKFTITPAEGNFQQLPKMQTSPSQSLASHSPRPKQMLPSLETALRQIDVDDAPYSAQSSAISRPSPSQYSHFGPSPSSHSSHSNPSPGPVLSPPRSVANTAYWRSSGPETNNSTPSDQASAGASAGLSTPATSYFSHPSSQSANIPGPTGYEADNMSAISTASSQLTDGSNQVPGGYVNGIFKCTIPGCNAAPFQTQYLLNSHANVHSNTRPHFCPVQGCPRGPGGQGFKRKNEMIRHGLVHQSPGYVCPFCPDQQHKYPRPDNLQRHVRVHHVEIDRNDALLRDILAQRPQGGNRGRRRRLGS